MSTNSDTYRFGMIGLGVMGRNLLLNMADHDVSIAGYDKDKEKGAMLEKEAQGKPAKGFTELGDFVNSLQKPRAIMLLVPAGKPVDDVIDALVPLLDQGDLIIDGGNSHFTDTNRRVDYLDQKGLHFFGMGVSGGEEGARRGPSMMPGGDKQAYDVVKPVFESIAAKVNGEPCVTYIGPGASGHFTKMVHNGIEYGLMQLIAETYGLMKNGLNMDNTAIGEVFAKWNEGRLKSFLMDITKDIFVYKEEGSDHLLLDDIKDEARSKGTGKWTSQAAMDLQAPIGTIDTAVGMRDLSKYKAMREEAAKLYPDTETIEGDAGKILEELENAFYFAMIITYAQGMHMLSRASDEYGYDLKLNEIAKIWRGGCIIRSEFLNDIYNAYTGKPDLGHLLLDKNVETLVSGAVPGSRSIISTAIKAGIAVPAYASAISYFDAFRSGRLPSNLIQAQRDYFGSHTYELIGREGVFHTKWAGKTV